MKKRYPHAIPLTIGILLFLFSCNDTKNANTGSLEFDSIQINKTEHLFGDSLKPACNLVVNFAYPAKSSDDLLKDSITHSLIEICFGTHYRNTPIQKLIQQYSGDYAERYKKDLEPLYIKDQQDKHNSSENIAGWYSYYKKIHGQVVDYRKDLLIYCFSQDEYTGGAHGLATKSYYNFDLKLMRPLHLSDIFTDNYKEAVTDLIWNQLMADNRVTTHEELEDLGYASTGDLTPTENFYLDKQGITFHYNPYEIAPYSMGAIQVNIPYAMMKHLLNAGNPITEELAND